MSISQRVFGSDLDKNVKAKLEAKQNIQVNMRDGKHTTENADGDDVKPGELINSDFHYNENQSAFADLSSNTPFIRMWVAVRDYQKISQEEVGQEETISFESHKDYADYKQNPDNYPQYTIDTFHKEAEKQAENLAIEYGTKVIPTKDKGVYIVKKNHKPLDEQIYVIGNYVYNEMSAARHGQTNQIISTFPREEVSGRYTADQSSNPNEFLRPEAGITSMTSNNEDSLGVIRRTTVNFKVNNFHDFENIYQTYFLKPGAQIFIDYGWSNVDLYRPSKLIKADKPEGFLFCQSDILPDLCEKDDEGNPMNGYITEAAGDMDTLVGVVTNFTSNILTDGTVECELELISKNSALMGQNWSNSNGSLYDRIAFQLEINGVRQAIIEQYRAAGVDYDQLLTWQPNVNIGSQERDIWKNNLDVLIRILTSSKDDQEIPLSTAMKTGYFGNKKSGQLFISWGRFEDDVLNKELAYGDVEGNNFAARFDSSQSFTSWTLPFQQLSEHKSKNGDEQKIILPPSDDTDLSAYGKNAGVAGWDETFNTEPRGEFGIVKTPASGENKGYPENLGGVTKTKYDVNLGRIPLREVFINIKTIKEAFAKSKKTGDTSDILKSLFDEIRKETGGIMDWAVYSNGVPGASMAIIDNNFVNTAALADRDQNVWDNLFVFDITSNKSIVQNYKIEFNMGDGDIGNLMAIRGMDVDTQIFPEDATAAAFLDLANMELVEDDNYFIKYEPNMGDFQAAVAQSKKDLKSYYQNLFTNSDTQFKIDTAKNYSTKNAKDDTAAEFVKRVKNKLGNLSHFSGKNSKNNDVLSGKKGKDQIDGTVTSETEYNAFKKQEAEAALDFGYKLCGDASCYYQAGASKEFFKGRSATLLPIKLDLTIHGFASLRPGDIFTVNYLPKQYLKHVFFQVIRCNHTITSQGWVTNLETQWRIKPSSRNAVFSHTAEFNEGPFVNVDFVRKQLAEVTKPSTSQDWVNNGVHSLNRLQYGSDILNLLGYMTKIEMELTLGRGLPITVFSFEGSSIVYKKTKKEGETSCRVTAPWGYARNDGYAIQYGTGWISTLCNTPYLGDWVSEHRYSVFDSTGQGWYNYKQDLSDLDYHCDFTLSEPIGMHPVCYWDYYKDAGDPLLAEAFDRTYIQADGTRYYLVIHHNGGGKWWCVVPGDKTDNQGMRLIDRVIKLAESVSATINDATRKPFWHSLFPKFYNVATGNQTQAMNHDGDAYAPNSLCMKNDIKKLAKNQRAGKLKVSQFNHNCPDCL